MVSYADFVHIFLTTFALIVLISAALQALLLASQEWMLKHKQAIGFIQYFPPLEVMETYLFMLISIVIVLLTLVLASSLILFIQFLNSVCDKKYFYHYSLGGCF